MAVGCCSQYFSGHHSPPLELPSDWKSQQILFWVRALIRCRRVCLTKGWHSHEYILKNTGQMELSIRSSPEKEAQKITELLSCLWSSPSNIAVPSLSSSASFIYCNAKSDMDFLPSPLHLCSSAAGWKVANQRQWSSVMYGKVRERVTNEHWFKIYIYIYTHVYIIKKNRYRYLMMQPEIWSGS